MANVLITGSSNGFGLLTAKTLKAKGHTIYATMRDPAGRNAPKAKDLENAPGAGKVHVIDLDVTSDDSVTAAVGKALEIGPIDVLVNNAGGGTGGITEAFTMSQMHELFDLNVYGVHRLNRAVLPHMRERGSGLLINVSSVLGRIVMPFCGVYTATKYALEGLSESLRFELAPFGVDVVVVEPGGFGTGFFAAMAPPKDEATVKAYGPVADYPNQMWGGVAEMLQGDDAPDPQVVADAILEAIETPAGERPLRVVVDPMMGGEGPKALNKASDEIARGMLTGMKMESLLSVKKS